MPGPLLRTKLFTPPRRPDLIPRPHLVARMDETFGAGTRLILISAPAGYGKSTLVSEWVHRQTEPGGPKIGWLSLDPEDDDEILFWQYVVSALETANPELGKGTGAYLQSQPAPIRGLLTHLLNRAASPHHRYEIVLILDDYHLITNSAIHEEMSFLLAHLPPCFRIIIITRADPPLPIARMQARAAATTIRANALRFGQDEATAFLNEKKKLRLLPEQVTVLAQRTEGWPAGLQMAALAIESVGLSPEGKSIVSLVEEFGGMQRYILDYLLQEILSRQSAKVRTFLLKTSILDRFCVDLCKAMFAGSEQEMGADRHNDIPDKSRSASILADIKRSNLFLIPLDQSRTWYRYHHLFADLLRARLRQRWPEEIPDLHLRAARWYRDQELASEAIGHALKAGDSALAGRLIEEYTHPLLIRGEIHTLLRSIAALPEGAARRRPWLAVYQAWALTLGGHYQPAAKLVAVVEKQVRADDMPGPDGAESAELRGHFAAIRAFQAATTVVGGTAVAHAQEALALLPAAALWPRGLAEWSLGYAHRMRGRLGAAAPYFAEVIRIGHAHGDLQAIASAQYDLAMVRRQQGRLQEAHALLAEIMDLAAAQGAENVGYLGRVEAGLAGVLLAQNRLVDARRHVERSLQLNETWQNPNHDYRTLLTLARLEVAEGNIGAAEIAWQKADAIGRQFPIVPVLKDLSTAVRVQLWLKKGNRQAATRWLARAGWAHQNLMQRAGESTGNEQTLLAAVRVHLATARQDKENDGLQEVMQALDSLLAHCRRAGHGEAAIAALALQALTRHCQQNREQARALLAEALRMAAAAGFVRLFLDEGEAMRQILHDLEPTLWANEDRLQAFVRSLREAFVGVEEADRPSAGDVGDQTELVEPLTERELEILALLAEGLTNQQIADRLFIARGTVKAHAASIYGKLGVHNRTEAAARGRALNLV